MYCPKCLNDTLKIKSNGVIKITFNGKHRDTSLFTFNFSKESDKKILGKLEQKIVEFLSWYSEFNNKSPLKNFEAFSNDFVCSQGCQMGVDSKISVIGPVFGANEVYSILQTECEKYKLKLEIDKSSFT